MSAKRLKSRLYKQNLPLQVLKRSTEILTVGWVSLRSTQQRRECWVSFLNPTYNYNFIPLGEEKLRDRG
ncbi:hypothetical protein [Nostoc sp. LPT]|uniref:hypothetical protein n=1 Tax=Nostoc sp. LPT TaxID=2815387 RepID=UPI001D3C54CE|nr:hypothetical protein [Nostoc sp. LPT]MBN4005334.1 hypothetical protein [Nostoc sp. LPT]